LFVINCQHVIIFALEILSLTYVLSYLPVIDQNIFISFTNNSDNFSGIDVLI